jgi:uncharacterized protein
MLTQLPHHIDPIQLADRGARLQGELPLSGFRRLAESLWSEEGRVRLDLLFSRNQNGIRCVEGEIKARLRVLCQRCMGPMDLEANSAVRLELLTDPGQPSRMPPDYEPFIVPLESTPLVELVEDELILALPISPLHPDKECMQPGWISNENNVTKPNPFAVLANLKNT